MNGKTLRRIELMHYIFGKLPDSKCGECSNLRQYHYRGRGYRKCKVYGETHSEASDWTKKWTACGCFNCEYSDRNIIELVGTIPNTKEPPLEGQTEIAL